MPTQTFFNLPEEKRQAIIDIAVDEFAEHDYKSASISRIVARASIAKGSFYQYFADKKDLYLYLLDLAAQKKMELLQSTPPPDPSMNFFDYLRWLVRAGVRYDHAYPKLSRVASRALYGDMPFRDETLQRMRETAFGYMQQLVAMGVAAGHIDPGVNPEVAAYMLLSAFTNLGDFLVERGYIALPTDDRPTVEIADQEGLNRIFDEVVGILQHGLAPRR